MSEEELFTEWVGTGYDAYKINYKKEYEKLNNIINEMEESLKDDKEEYQKDLDLETRELYNEFWRGYSMCAKFNLEHLQKLTGSDKECLKNL